MKSTKIVDELLFNCYWCHEFALADDCRAVPLFDQGATSFVFIHTACFIRGIIGSVEHQERRCTCYGGKAEESHIVSPRLTAIAAVSLGIYSLTLSN